MQKNICRCLWESCYASFETENDAFEHTIKSHAILGKQVCCWIANPSLGRCNLTIKHKGHFKDHLVTHFSLLLRPFVCVHCSKLLRNRQQLSRHTRIFCEAVKPHVIKSESKNCEQIVSHDKLTNATPILIRKDLPFSLPQEVPYRVTADLRFNVTKEVPLNVVNEVNCKISQEKTFQISQDPSFRLMSCDDSSNTSSDVVTSDISLSRTSNISMSNEPEDDFDVSDFQPLTDNSTVHEVDNRMEATFYLEDQECFIEESHNCYQNTCYHSTDVKKNLNFPKTEMSDDVVYQSSSNVNQTPVNVVEGVYQTINVNENLFQKTINVDEVANNNNSNENQMVVMKGKEVETHSEPTTSVLPVTISPNDIFYQVNSLERLCKTFLRNSGNAILRFTTVPCPQGWNVGIICNSFANEFNIEIPEEYKEVVAKTHKFTATANEPTYIDVKYVVDLANRIGRLNLTEVAVNKYIENQHHCKIKSKYGFLIERLVNTLSFQLDAKLKILSKEGLLMEQNIKKNFLPVIKKISSVRRLLLIITKVIRLTIMKYISNVDQIDILEPTPSNQFFRNCYDCTGSALIIHYNIKLTMNPLMLKLRKSSFKNLADIFKLEINNLVKDLIYGKYREDCLKLCCFGLLCQNNIEIKNATRFNLNYFEDDTRFYFLLRLGNDLSFIFKEPNFANCVNELNLRNVET
ncbi:hypothetical protein HDU92_004178 [Lobulomyces angularis]|nr:hypothetical protein HDU92_004178 [Lobulomyces angularis]